MLNDQLLERYSRQILLPEIDLAGQEIFGKPQCSSLAAVV